MVFDDKSRLTINAIVNAIKGIMNIIFPLLTFPYVSRILGAEQLGRYNFSQSIISYFSLIAGLGVASYAIREGARIRSNQKKFNDFAQEIFTINIFATLFAYALLIVVLMYSAKIKEYYSLISILSIGIFLQTIGVEWIYNAYERYVDLAIRNISFQFLSIILLFLFVKSPDDLEIYAWITLTSSAGVNIINYIYAGEYCKLRIKLNLNIVKHLKSILLLFATSITIIIYVSSDITILGFLCDDYEVGLYSVSVKVYSVLKTVVASLLVVFVPLISTLISNKNYKDIRVVATRAWNMLITAILPIVLLVICMSKEIVLVVAGDAYIDAYSSLIVLGVSLLFCMGAFFWGQCILIPFREERMLFHITTISATFNIVLNFILIPIYKQNGAALTTVVAEMVSFICCFIVGRRYVRLDNLRCTFLKTLMGLLTIVIVVMIGRYNIISDYMRLLAVGFGSILAYILVELVLKNEAVYQMFDVVRRRYK